MQDFSIISRIYDFALAQDLEGEQLGQGARVSRRPCPQWLAGEQGHKLKCSMRFRVLGLGFRGLGFRGAAASLRQKASNNKDEWLQLEEEGLDRIWDAGLRCFYYIAGRMLLILHATPPPPPKKKKKKHSGPATYIVSAYLGSDVRS